MGARNHAAAAVAAAALAVAAADVRYVGPAVVEVGIPETVHEAVFEYGQAEAGQPVSISASPSRNLDVKDLPAEWPTCAAYPCNLTAAFKGKFPGYTTIVVGGANGAEVLSVEDLAKVVINEQPVSRMFTYVMVLAVLLILLGLGTTFSKEQLVAQFRRPVGLGIGFLCQFIWMPLLAFIIAVAADMEDEQAVGLVFMGSAPGGASSNLVTYFANGDTALSIAMTTASNLCALFMMPLNLVIYARRFTGKNVDIPFVNIVTGLAMLAIPVSTGLYVRQRYGAEISKKIEKFGTRFGVIAISCSLTLAVIEYHNIVSAIEADMALIPMMLPIFGYALGAGTAWAARRPPRQVRTIAIETSIQNAVLATALARLSWESPERDQILIPIMFYNLSVLPLSILSTYAIYKLQQAVGLKDEDIEAKYDDSSSKENMLSGDGEPTFNPTGNLELTAPAA